MKTFDLNNIWHGMMSSYFSVTYLICKSMSFPLWMEFNSLKLLTETIGIQILIGSEQNWNFSLYIVWNFLMIFLAISQDLKRAGRIYCKWKISSLWILRSSIVNHIGNMLSTHWFAFVGNNLVSISNLWEQATFGQNKDNFFSLTQI